MKFTRESFEGGLNMQFDPSRIAANEYPLLFNGRCRDGVIRPVKSPALCADCPEGNYQGLYASGRYALLIASGKAYIKDFELGGAFNEVAGLQLDADVDVIYAESVPSSTRNFERVPVSVNKNGGVNLVSPLAKTDAAVVLQDGINQPWLIAADGTGRIAKSYAQWTRQNPEYVPIGKQMLHDNGILYIVSPDGSQIYRMCTDAPLNGMVNITSPAGDKQAAEQDGGAHTVSHVIGIDQITCLAALNTPDNAFFAGTRRLGSLVVPDFVNTIFGEPLFDNIDVFPVGPVNQFSIAEKMGDYIFVTSKGIRSFNATLTMKNESRNAPFSRRIQRAFRNITQTNPCIGKFDDYIFCAVSTVYGNAVMVFDETLDQWVAIDQYANVSRIKQFATVVTSTREVLLFITEDNKLYEAFNGAASETAKLYIGDFTSHDPDVLIKPETLKVVVANAEEAGLLTVTPYVGRRKRERQTNSEEINSNRAADAVPITVPFGDDSVTNEQVVVFNTPLLEQGWRVGFLLTLNCQAEITHVSFDATEETQQAPLHSEIKRRKSIVT